MTLRQRIASSLVVFTVVVSASFAYGLLLLWRGPARPGPSADARPAPLPPDVLVQLARSAEMMKEGEVEQAIRGYRRVLTLGPSLEALLGLAEGEWRSGRLDQAVAEYERVLRLDPRNPVLVDGSPVLEERIRGGVKRSVLGIKLREGRLRHAVEVAPGRHRIVVTVRWDEGERTDSIAGSFAAGKTRRLTARVGRIGKGLSLEWE